MTPAPDALMSGRRHNGDEALRHDRTDMFTQDRPAAVPAATTGLPAATGQVLRHHRGPLLADMLRAGFGSLVVALPVFVVQGLGMVAVGVLSLLVALFAGFGIQRAIRLSEVWRAVPGPHGFIERHSLTGRRRIALHQLTRLKLLHYAPRRGGGWFRLILTDQLGHVLAVEDSLRDFNHLVATALTGAGARHLTLDGVTRHNLSALGLRVPQTCTGEGGS